MAKAKGDRASELAAAFVDAMRHAVGMGSAARPTSKRHWGKRNRFAVSAADAYGLAAWDQIEVEGLSRCWDRTAGGGRSTVVMYSLTAAGCRELGMHAAAIARAVSP